ncbi:O-antigen ligase family protein [Paraburkholderia sediminicola]|uniref:O-antigen ligase family protein n=1 Tax=Paraburkholderia sediminicola TaxID=458836 RepID=UPI0038BB06B4
MRHQYATLWIWLFLLPLALDYKAPDANVGHFVQFVFVIPVIAAGLALALIAPRFHNGSRLRSVVTFSVLLCVVGSIVAQFVQDNDTGNYLRVLLPFVLFLLGYLVACRPWSEYRISQFEKALFVANVICLVFTFVYGLATAGDLEDARFRIISVTLLGLQGVLLHEFVVAKRFSFFTIAVFALSVIVELLSVTRSLLVGTVLLFLIAMALSAPSIQLIWRTAARSVMTVAVLAGVVGIVAVSFPTVTEHWTQRIFASEETVTGKDPTTITRLAEMRDQYDQVTASPETLLFGEGYGHYYRYSPVYLPDLAGQISEKDFYAINEWPAGHNFWVYQLFAGGLLFGVGMPLATLAALVICFFSYRYWRSVVPDAPMLPVLGRAIMLFAALPATSIGGNPLGPRFSGLIFGLALGLMIATHARLQRALPARVRRAPTPPHLRPAAMPELPGRIQPGTGRADLATTLGMSPVATTAPGSSQFGALVSRTTSTQNANRRNIVR